MTWVTGLVSPIEEHFWLHAVVFLRVGAIVSLMPGFGARSVSVRVKLALSVALAVIVAPLVSTELQAQTEQTAGFVSLAVVETGIGLAIGVGLRLFVIALQICGSMAAQATSLSQILGTASATPLPALGHFLVVGGLAFSMMLGLHVKVTEMTVMTYDIFPIGKMPHPASLSEWGIQKVTQAFSLAFTISAPFVLVSILYNLTLGIVNRAMPQLMVVFVGAPVITGIGLLFLMLLAPAILTIWAQQFDSYLANPFGGR